MSDETNPDTIVIGAGVAGLSTALYLQMAGQQVMVIDPLGPAGGASFGNAGMFSPDTAVPIACLAWCGKCRTGSPIRLGRWWCVRPGCRRPRRGWHAG